MARFKLGALVSGPVPPQLKPHTLKLLGTEDADALQIEAQSLFNVSNLLPKAEAARVRREAKGISDRVEAAQPLDAPPFDSRLVEKRIEVCWPYKENGKTVKIWATGTVKHTADGLTDRSSKRAQKVLPAGAVLWAREADPDGLSTTSPRRGVRSGCSYCLSGGTSMCSTPGAMLHARREPRPVRMRPRTRPGSRTPRQTTSI